jgi:hypothetical protein
MEVVNFRISKENLEKLDAICKLTERNRTQMITYLIKTAYGDIIEPLDGD